MAKRKKTKRKKQRIYWYVFGRKSNGTTEFIRRAYCYSAKQACAFLKEKHAERVSPYLKIWARKKLESVIEDGRPKQTEMLF